MATVRVSRSNSVTDLIVTRAFSVIAELLVFTNQLQAELKSENRQERLYLCPKKVSPLMFDNNFGKCGPMYKILSANAS